MNWSEYNKNLVKRGNINLWMPDDILEWWYAKDYSGTGRPVRYSDKAIEHCLTIGSIFKMPLRMTEGFLNSLFQRGNMILQVPSYTQISRRAGSLKISLPKLPRGGEIDIAFDSTGLKVFGEGEWKTRQHGVSKRRTWRKLHLAIDTKSLKIVGATLTQNSVDDASVAASMLVNDFDGACKKVLGDGAYDKLNMHVAARKTGAELITPPAKNARQQKTIINPAKMPRDQTIARIRMYGNDEEARKKWKKEVGYHKRSLAETTICRYKTAFTGKMQFRKFDNQRTEAAIKVNILNAITKIGFGGIR